MRLKSFLTKALWVLPACWIVWLIWLGRYEMLDDALIHLRYAAMLQQHHIISYDGVHANYGASSLLYVALLATLRSLFQSPLLPKFVSCIAYVGLLVTCVRRNLSSIWTVALVCVLASPMAVRWLTDGMETSLVSLFAVLLALAVRTCARPWLLFLLAFAIGLLRVDLTLLLVFACAIAAVQRQWTRTVAIAAGACGALLMIRITMGHILPDTALAKVGLSFSSVLGSTAYVIGAAYSFGVGLVLLWCVTGYFALRQQLHRNDRTRAGVYAVVLANAVLPVLVLAAAVKGQQMQGVRYLDWALLFSIVWNTCTLDTESHSPVAINRPRWVSLIALLAVCAWAFELPLYRHIVWGRTQTFLTMRDAHLDRLAGYRGLSADVGFIGYFSRADLCDENRLVNGRDAARRSFDDQLRTCIAERPAFAFLSAAQIGYTSNYMSWNGWMTCGSVIFTNARSIDQHALYVRRSDFPEGCPVHF